MYFLKIKSFIEVVRLPVYSSFPVFLLWKSGADHTAILHSLLIFFLPYLLISLQYSFLLIYFKKNFFWL